ncbi:peroxisomal trans-2-enoyl-CoA reductase-like [Strongylocentrotus purpuratus]|uniref:Peroxisomal trans-2-enoyl-CoA reductase n=1 Tax=Strongylocentrotus purpuratus TaxID=7668 RepID=A0A7M7G9H7_STRPU|nr:peroxisomal trans-2-enoyl-CoA reductase-like [Strongylocentrotus purpuratus]
MALNAQVRSVFRSGLFSDKVAIVTGGGTGIGRTITKELLFLGCKVVIASRNAERLQTAADALKASLPQDSTAAIQAIQCNIRKEDEVKALMKTTVANFGKIDFLVNNGGGQFLSPVSKISTKGWNAVVDTNLTGTFMCCREAFLASMEENGGVIVNILGDLWRGFPSMAHSCAARAGVLNLTKTASLEWAHHGVRINSVAPGTVFGKEASEHYGSNKLFELAIPAIPAKRLGTPEEISAAVTFLLSPAASYITGETIKVDGGSSLYQLPLGFTVKDHNNMPAYSWDSEEESEGEMVSGKPVGEKETVQ